MKDLEEINISLERHEQQLHTLERASAALAGGIMSYYNLPNQTIFSLYPKPPYIFNFFRAFSQKGLDKTQILC